MGVFNKKKSSFQHIRNFQMGLKFIFSELILGIDYNEANFQRYNLY